MTVVRAKSMTTERSHNAKGGGFTASEIERRYQERLDQVESTVLCAFCPGWSFTGPAVEARAAASLHREEQHPGLGNGKRRTVKRECKVPGCIKHCKPGSDRCWDHTTVKETAGAERPAEAAVSSTAVLGEAASEPAKSGAVRSEGPAGAASPNTDERTEMECKVEGCTGDASSAPKKGFLAALCGDHRAAKSAEISAARTGQPRGARGTTLGGATRPGRNARRPRKTLRVPPTETGPTATKAEALLEAARNVDEAEKILEQARAQLKEAVDGLAA